MQQKVSQTPQKLNLAALNQAKYLDKYNYAKEHQKLDLKQCKADIAAVLKDSKVL